MRTVGQWKRLQGRLDVPHGGSTYRTEETCLDKAQGVWSDIIADLAVRGMLD